LPAFSRLERLAPETPGKQPGSGLSALPEAALAGFFGHPHPTVGMKTSISRRAAATTIS